MFRNTASRKGGVHCSKKTLENLNQQILDRSCNAAFTSLSREVEGGLKEEESLQEMSEQN